MSQAEEAGSNTKKVKEKLESCGYKCTLTKSCKWLKHFDLIKTSKKNVARIEIICNDNDKFEVTVFRKTEFGGYAINKESPYAPSYSRGARYVNFKGMRQIIEHFFALPEVAKKKDKPKDDRNSIFQNALARAIQEKSGYSNISKLAHGERDATHINLNHVGIKIFPKEIRILWETLRGVHQKITNIEPASPNFDPDKFIDAIIALDQKQVELHKQLKDSDGILDGLDKVSGL